jgi:peptidoglycan/LPS O-acetylase OafA/YrhL
MPRVPFLVVPLVLTAILEFRPAAHVSIYSDLLMIGFIFPLLLLVGAASPPPRALTKVAAWLGRASYAVYMLHVPLESCQAYVWEHLRHRTMAADQPLAGVVGLVAVIAVALVVDQFYDEPLRAYLRRRLRRSPVAERAPAAAESGAV